jgi:aspartyl-tRNA synthetase
MRDRSGVVQIGFERANIGEDQWQTVIDLRPEYCIQVEGVVELRPSDARNPNMPTGDIEIRPQNLTVLNRCPPLPFPISRESDVSEGLALKYRYLQMRRPDLSANLVLRHELVLFLRNMLSNENFIEIETPLLTRSTPEGARDFLVPSRLYPGQFFALPQSPQQYKELLMVGGVDKYFQFARCLRDEDARADRQAEHTQIDFEMSFVARDDIIEILEKIFVGAATRFSTKQIMESPIPRMTFADVMNRYGSDKPDLRFELELKDVAPAFVGCAIPALREAAESPDQCIRALVIPDGGLWSRKQLDELREMPARFGGGILSWIALKDGELRSSSVKKALDGVRLQRVRELSYAGPCDLILLAAGPWKRTLEFLGRLRVHYGKTLKLIDEQLLAFLFVVDFPQFEWNEETSRLDPVHHMFVLPKEDHVGLLDTDPLSVLSSQVDAVCNGYELCSGSLRIYQRDLQLEVMNIIGISTEEAEQKFGHLLSALEFGAPPHGGAAPGLDRLLMVLTGTERMADVVAFPKTYSGRDLMMDAPAAVDDAQLRDLHLRLVDHKPSSETLEDGHKA